MQPGFDDIEGITRTVVGYSGGRNTNPSYKSVSNGDGHAEAIRCEYDTTTLSYTDMLDAFWANYVGPGNGQYRAVIWYSTEEERKLAQARLEEERASGKWMDLQVSDIAISLEPVCEWFDAEPCHQYRTIGGVKRWKEETARTASGSNN